MRRRAVYFALAAATLVTGLMVRFAPLGLPWFVVKYGGSTLWAVMVYWVLVIARPKAPSVALASIACTISLLVELQRLYHSAWLDAFRVSLPGILLLGRFFSVRDILAYGLAIIAAALLDEFAISPRRALLESKQPHEVSLLWFYPGSSCRFPRE